MEKRPPKNTNNKTFNIFLSKGKSCIVLNKCSLPGMQSLDNCVSAGDICEARPHDPGKNALKVLGGGGGGVGGGAAFTTTPWPTGQPTSSATNTEQYYREY